MARSLQQIMAELDPYYSGSRQAVQTQLDAFPQQEQAELSGLDARLDRANENILNQARGRGLGFSGIPVAEQAKYAATEYAPAVANLKSKYVGQKNSLLEALNSLSRDQFSQAQGIFDNESQRELALRQLQEQQRQFNENLAFQRQQAEKAARGGGGGGGGYSLGGGGGGAVAAKPATVQGLFQGYQPGRDRFYTEKVVIPTLISQGMSPQQAQKMAYDYRKAAFGK